MDLAEKTNAAAIRLWQRHFQPEDDVLCPLFYPPLATERLLFVGMNPSSSNQVAQVVQNDPDLRCDYYDFFHFRNADTMDLRRAQQIEELLKLKYPFFSRFKNVSAEAKLEWEHVDLFFFRHTAQHQFRARIFEDVDSLTLNEFGRDQLKLSTWLIRHLKPRVIVVANALASRIFLGAFKTKFSEEFGFHFTKLGTLDVPTFFSAMLTGRQPLDRFSFERLKWHIRFALRHAQPSTN